MKELKDIRHDGKRRNGLLSAILLAALAILPAAGFAETRYAAPDGSASNSGNRASDPWDAASCFSRLEPGDSCIYASGNYGSTNFKPATRGTRANRIEHRCESQHGCVFDRIVLEDVMHLDITNIASDSNYYDSSKSFTNPRMALYNAHYLKFDSISVRGEPEQCSSGNPGPGCDSNSGYSRYNDLVKVGRADTPGQTASHIEITGKSRFINANHAIIQFFDDGDSNTCEDTESNFWIHGTKSDPIVFSNKYHHIVAFKGACNVLIEYADFQAAGNGRGDLQQPVKATDVQAGGIIHGSTMRNVVVRYSNFTNGGSGTDEHRNLAHIAVGLFGDEVNGACFPHNSHFRPWGPLALVSRQNEVARVVNTSIINNAVADGWYLGKTNSRLATSPYRGYLLSRTGAADGVDVDFDGIVADSASASEGLLYGRGGERLDFARNAASSDGVRFGDAVFTAGNVGFRNAGSGDFRPASNSPLISSAVPIATALTSGSGSTIRVSRPQCFTGSLGGMRAGDSIDVAGSRCTVTSTNVSRGTLSCAESLQWSAGDSIYYVSGGQLVTDIGSRMSTDSLASSSNNSQSPPKPPVFH